MSQAIDSRSIFSGKSHFGLFIIVRMRNQTEGTIKIGKLFLVDLVGVQNINAQAKTNDVNLKSIRALGNVVNALNDG